MNLRVTDMNGVQYACVREVGHGGQGSVLEVEGGRLAVKLISQASSTRREALRNQLARVRRMPLEGIRIARPLEMLREPHLGYVMELMTGMTPLKSLAYAPRDQSSPVAWYLAGGGLRRRLRLLARVADELARLHGRGIVYGDPSPGNILVSATAGDTEVRLIDADNLCHASAPGMPALYTPGYGAPELILGRSGTNSLTDAHAFSVLAFLTLAITHPLVGDAVAQGEPEREEEALCGCLPWIEDPAAGSNRATTGVPRERVLSPRLRELCGRAFGAGLRDAQARPGVAEWAECLHGAAGATLRCPECGGTFYCRDPGCPWCERAAPAFVRVIFNLWDPKRPTDENPLRQPGAQSRPPVVVGFAALAEGETLVIDGRLALGRNDSSTPQPLAELRFSEQRLSIRSLADGACELWSGSGNDRIALGTRERVFHMSRQVSHWQLHFGDHTNLHRVARFELSGGGTT